LDLRSEDFNESCLHQQSLSTLMTVFKTNSVEQMAQSSHHNDYQML